MAFSAVWNMAACEANPHAKPVRGSDIQQNDAKRCQGAVQIKDKIELKYK